ncbi:UNVERIFIED_CONTAM: hypothetical protein FKN15_043296 [Acipenser sinensis]
MGQSGSKMESHTKGNNDKFPSALTESLSVTPAMDLLEYCELEWKGLTPHADQIRKAYGEIYRVHNIRYICRVRGDNYCALRATLFQVLSNGIPFPSWMKEQDITKLPEKLFYSQGCNWIQQYSFGPEKYTGPKAFYKLRKCVDLLKFQWGDIYGLKDKKAREKACRLLFMDEASEYKMYEAVKFLMLYLAIEMFEGMRHGQDVPNFCAIEMFLLGYTLELQIQTFRLYKYGTEEFEVSFTDDDIVETQPEARGKFKDTGRMPVKDVPNVSTGVHDKRTKSRECPATEEINDTACTDDVQQTMKNGIGRLVKDAVQEDKRGLATETAGKDNSSSAINSYDKAKRPRLAEESVTSESCSEEEKTADTQAFESPDQADSVVEINIVQSLEDIGEHLTEGGKKAEAEESAVEMKDTERTPSIEMELESQSVTQEKPSAPKPLKSLDEEPMREMSAAVEDKDNASEADLYRGAEEIEQDQLERNGAKCVDDLMVPHNKCSICPEVDMLTYSKNEWRGNTAKSALMKKGYEEVYTNFSGLRRVRGDNYCAMRATLFQALVQSNEAPAWLQREDFIQLPEKLASCYDWIKQWRFTQENENGCLVELLRGHMQLLKRKGLKFKTMNDIKPRPMSFKEVSTPCGSVVINPCLSSSKKHGTGLLFFLKDNASRVYQYRYHRNTMCNFSFSSATGRVSYSFQTILYIPSCSEEEKTADTQAFESPDQADSVVEINIVQSLEDIGEHLTEGGKKAEAEESAVEMKDTERTPSIEMELESQSVTQEKPSAPKPLKSLDEEPMREMSAAVEDKDNASEADLYRGAEEIEQDQLEKNGAKCVDDLMVPHNKCSICPEVDMLTYSKNEWRGNTAKSALMKKWLAVVESSSAEERQAVCDEIFRNEEEEYSLLEAVKLLMLNTAIELYNDMQQEKDVPIFCWLLFARDSSDTPCTFLSNHLNQVGFSGGLEQGGKKAEAEESAVEMKDTERTPSIEMELESQSVTQEKPSAPKPLKSLDEEPMREMSAAVEDEDNASEADLYRGAEEIEQDQLERNGAKCVDDLMVPHNKCSICPEVDMLTYSKNEWRGNTAKSALMKKGYEEVYTNFSGLRRVRGDNYCAMRATLFQALVQSNEAPAWLQREDFIQLPEKLASCYDWIKQWRFTQENENGCLVELLRGHMQLLKRKWLAVVESSSAEERQAVCDEIFRNEEEEYSLLEAVKLLMLNTAIELYNDMQQEKDVPIFCWLLFARDSSDTPCTFLSNHLNQVGFSGGLEQVEMFLLGYALELTINVYRLYKFETDEFLTFYPDDHKEDWPAVSLITEDDRHYNVPVQKQNTTQL